MEQTKKRVAILVGRLQLGGMERVAALLSEMLTESDYEVYIFCFYVNQQLDYNCAGKKVLLHDSFMKGEIGLSQEFFGIMSNALEVRRNKYKHKIDITISFAPEMNLLNIFSDVGDKKVVTFHSCQSMRDDFKGVAHKRSIIRLSNHADKIVTVSKWCGKDLVNNYKIRKNKVKVIYNPIEDFSKFGITHNKENIVLIVGRLQDVKQQWHSIRAFRKVVDKIPDVKLLIAGSGENEKYLKKLVRSLQLNENVIFLGFVNGMQEVYRKAKVLVFSSASESLSCATLEAFSNGVPVVASDCPGGMWEIIAPGTKHPQIVKEVMCRKGGVVVPQMSGIKYDANIPMDSAEEMLADGMILLLEDKRLYRQMAENCLEISKHFTKDKIKRHWVKMIEAL